MPLSLLSSSYIVNCADQEGYTEELSPCFHLDTVLLKYSESVLSETYIFNMKMIDTHFESKQNQFLHLDSEKIL